MVHITNGNAKCSIFQPIDKISHVISHMDSMISQRILGKNDTMVVFMHMFVGTDLVSLAARGSMHEPCKTRRKKEEEEESTKKDQKNDLVFFACLLDHLSSIGLSLGDT